MPNCPKGQRYTVGQVTFIDTYEYLRNIHLTKQSNGEWHVEIHEYANPSPTPTGSSTVECSFNITDTPISLIEVNANEVEFQDLPSGQALGPKITFDVSSKTGPQTLITGIQAEKDGNGDWQVSLIGADDIQIGIVRAEWNLKSGAHLIHDSSKEVIIIELWKS